ncbi:diacylglycerol/polyprenol kinase family protein [Aliiroseovarius crassostreae]|uniref:diacylglycerol/polyprenol kinase family protein n=1 Tax=Aliiroseovarius crassostreae TaxID=154981 RepID=UPI003C7A66E1
MSPVLQIALALGSVALLLGMMAVVRRVSNMWQIRAEVQRKLVHVGTGLYALTLPWLFPDRWPVYALVVVTLIVMMVLRLPNSKLGRTLHGVERQSYGDLLLAISVGLCLFLAGDELYLYVLPIAVLTLADAAAALAGSTYGTRFFRVEDGEKSIEGSVVFFVVTLLISILCLMLMTSFAPPNIIVLSFMVAGFGTLVEAASWRGFDNFFLPLGLLIFLSVHAANPLQELAGLAVIFVTSIIAFKTISPKIGLTNHAGHVYVTTVFLLLAVTAVQNALVPILVLAAHAWSRIAAPCKSRFPDLDIVAALALVSFGWLTLGNATGWNAVSFYGITAMGMMVGLCALALTRRRITTRVALLSIIVLACCAVRYMVIHLNSESANWNGPMWSVTVTCLALSTIVPSLAPHAFAQARVTKLTCLSLAIPLATYLFSIDYSGFFT